MWLCIHKSSHFMLHLSLYESYAYSAHSCEMTYCLNSRDYRPCNHLFCPVAFQSSAHTNNIEEILRFPICKAVPTLIDSLCRARSHTEPINRRSWAKIESTNDATYLVIPHNPPFPFLRLIFAIYFNRSSTARSSQ